MMVDDQNNPPHSKNFNKDTWIWITIAILIIIRFVSVMHMHNPYTRKYYRVRSGLSIFYTYQLSYKTDFGHYTPPLEDFIYLDEPRYKNATFGFREDDPLIKQYCPDCTLSKEKYKFAGYIKKDGHFIFLTIDHNQNINQIDLRTRWEKFQYCWAYNFFPFGGDHC